MLYQCQKFILHFTFAVRVYRTGCPTINTQRLQWYKLEAFAAGTNTSIGAFVEPIQSRRLETYSCHDESVSSILLSLQQASMWSTHGVYTCVFISCGTHLYYFADNCI